MVFLFGHSLVPKNEVALYAISFFITARKLVRANSCNLC